MRHAYNPDTESSYYPPRARWYAFVFVLGEMLRHRLAIDRISLPARVKIGELIAGFLVPGLAVWLRGPRYWGVAALTGGATLGLVFIVGLGFPVANLAFGMLVSLHVTGFVYYCQPLLNGEAIFARLRFTLLAMLAAWLLLYLPGRALVLVYWVTPLRLHDRVMVMRRECAPRNIRRGDWVAYTLPSSEEGPHGDVVVVHAGLGLGPVLGVAGDRVKFDGDTFSVNGVSHPKLWRMPSAGEFTVPENNWFIWPDLDISGHGNVQENSIDSAILQMASVNFTSFYGKPFQRWFGRKQL